MTTIADRSSSTVTEHMMSFTLYWFWAATIGTNVAIVSVRINTMTMAFLLGTKKA
jgi:hypothetical protein